MKLLSVENLRLIVILLLIVVDLMILDDTGLRWMVFVEVCGLD